MRGRRVVTCNAIGEETVWLKLGCNERALFRCDLDRKARHRLVVAITSDEEVAAVLWGGVDAMREERAREGRVGQEWARARGLSFEMHAEVGGGYWLLSIENWAGLRTDVVARIYVEHPVGEEPCGCSIKVRGSEGA